MKYTPQLYILTAKTNLHPGSGSQNYGIIDNLVQRDPASGFPAIYASSLKGALREYFHHRTSDQIQAGFKNSPLVRYIFGADVKDEAPEKPVSAPQNQKQPAPNRAGAYRFLDAQLLSLPVRSDQKPFFRATCPAIVQQFMDRMQDFGHWPEKEEQTGLHKGLKDLAGFAKEGDFQPVHFSPTLSEKVFHLEDFDLQPIEYRDKYVAALHPLLGEDFVLLNDADFQRLTNDNHLPVVARNSLEDGRSENLWYEQVLPRQTRFAFWVLVPDREGDHFAQFSQHLSAELVQVGANASIGYGLCDLQPFSFTAKTA